MTNGILENVLVCIRHLGSSEVVCMNEPKLYTMVLHKDSLMPFYTIINATEAMVAEFEFYNEKVEFREIHEQKEG